MQAYNSYDPAKEKLDCNTKGFATTELQSK